MRQRPTGFADAMTRLGLHLGGSPSAPLFNPSIAPWERGGFLVIARSGNHNQLFVLDSDLRSQRMPVRLHLRQVSASTDARIVPRGGSVFSLIYWDCSPNDLSTTGMATREVRLSPTGKPDLSPPLALRYARGGPVEKNWTPLQNEGVLHLVWTLCPFELLHLDPNSGACTSRERILYHDGGWRSRYGEIHGGTPFIAFSKRELLCVFQSSTRVHAEPERSRMTYYAGAMTVSNGPPWQVLRMTSNPLLGPDDAQPGPCSPASTWCTADSRIIFPAGIAIVGDSIVVSCGINDHSSALFRFSRRDLDSALDPVDQSSRAKAGHMATSIARRTAPDREGAGSAT